MLPNKSRNSWLLGCGSSPRWPHPQDAARTNCHQRYRVDHHVPATELHCKWPCLWLGLEEHHRHQQHPGSGKVSVWKTNDQAKCWLELHDLMAVWRQVTHPPPKDIFSKQRLRIFVGETSTCPSCCLQSWTLHISTQCTMKKILRLRGSMQCHGIHSQETHQPSQCFRPRAE